MKVCPKCSNQCSDSAIFCNVCGASLAAQPEQQQQQQQQQQYQQQYQQQQYQQQQYQQQYQVPPTDHTAEFDGADISQNKVIAMAPYMLSFIGIIIALLAANSSKYAAFHVRQALKIEIISMLLIICMAVLFWTILVPIAGAVCMIILLVIRIICFFSVCSGKAKEPPIISGLGFLK